MICYERGCFQLDDALSKYCPEWASTQVLVGGDADEPELVDQETPITIKQLFTHTAGLPPLGPSLAMRVLQSHINPLHHVAIRDWVVVPFFLCNFWIFIFAQVAMTSSQIAQTYIRCV